MKKYVYAFCLVFFTMTGLLPAQPLCSGTPVAGTTKADDTLSCLGDTVSLRLEGLTSSGLMFQWQSSTDGTTYAGISGAIDSVYSTALTESTWFRCVVTCVSSGLSSTSPELLVTVAENPPAGGIINATHTGLTYFFTVTGMSGTFVYSWDFGDGTSLVMEDPAHAYAVEGTYTVTVIISNGCGDDTLQDVFTVLSLDEMQAYAKGIRLFPNPARNEFCLAAKDPLWVDRIRISDVAGRVRWTQHAQSLLPLVFSTSQVNLVRGTYIVEVILESDELPIYLRLLVE